MVVEQTIINGVSVVTSLITNLVSKLPYSSIVLFLVSLLGGYGLTRWQGMWQNRYTIIGVLGILIYLVLLLGGNI